MKALGPLTTHIKVHKWAIRQASFSSNSAAHAHTHTHTQLNTLTGLQDQVDRGHIQHDVCKKVKSSSKTKKTLQVITYFFVYTGVLTNTEL